MTQHCSSSDPSTTVRRSRALTIKKGKAMKRKLVGLAAVATASALVLAGCASGGGSAPSTDGKGKTVTLWLVGADTPDALRNYLKTEFHKETGATLNIQQQD